MTSNASPSIATCIGCGCTDYHACYDARNGCSCHWLAIDYTIGKGICSCCDDHLERWKKGDREVAVPSGKDNHAELF